MKKQIPLSIIFMMALVFLGGCSKQETVVQTFEDESSSFSITVPADWVVQKEMGWSATADMEASPDVGLYIYVDNPSDRISNRIYFYRQHGHASSTHTFDKEVQINDTLTAKRYEDKTKEYITIDYIFQDGFHGMSIFLETSVYKKNKKALQNAIDSIVIVDKVNM